MIPCPHGHAVCDKCEESKTAVIDAARKLVDLFDGGLIDPFCSYDELGQDGVELLALLKERLQRLHS